MFEFKITEKNGYQFTTNNILCCRSYLRCSYAPEPKNIYMQIFFSGDHPIEFYNLIYDNIKNEIGESYIYISPNNGCLLLEKKIEGYNFVDEYNDKIDEFIKGLIATICKTYSGYYESSDENYNLYIDFGNGLKSNYRTVSVDDPEYILMDSESVYDEELMLQDTPTIIFNLIFNTITCQPVVIVNHGWSSAGMNKKDAEEETDDEPKEDV